MQIKNTNLCSFKNHTEFKLGHHEINNNYVLCKANPHWVLAEMIMNEHLKLTTDEAVQRIKKDYHADVLA